MRIGRMSALDPLARVQGWAKCLFDAGEDPNIDLPMLTKVYEDPARGGELWVGGAGIWPREPAYLPDDFDYVLQLTERERFEHNPNIHRDVVILADTARQTFESIPSLAQELADRIESGQKVLVHCQAGMNRSGLVAAAALVKLGFRPHHAINRLRKERDPVVLCNPSFEAYIRGLE